MKKIILIALAVLLVLSAAMLCGCSPKEDTSDPFLYWNADKGMERTPEADGSYQVNFLKNGEQVTYRVTDEAMMTRIDAQKAMGLVLDGDTITEAIYLADMPQYYLALNYTVQSIGGSKVKFNSLRSFSGMEVLVEIDESISVLDVSEYAEVKGTPTTLQKGDGVTIIANGDGSVNTIFVDGRQGIFTTQMRYCPICEKDVEFTNWFSSASMPFFSGHFYLEKDIELAMSTSTGQGEITLDLNGKTVTMVKEGQRFYTLGEGSILNLIDTVGGGKAVVASSGAGPFMDGMFVRMDGFGCEFNMYSGTIDASNAVANHGVIVNNYNGVLNVYGGTMIGGTTFGVGGGAIIVQSHVNIYGGEIIGGHCHDLGGYKDNPPGGGTIRHNGTTTTLNIFGGIIKGGKSEYVGGCIYINGPATISGDVLITGGSAKQGGGGLYVNITGEPTISGDVKIIDNEDGDLCLSTGRLIAIGEAGLGENAKLGISMETPGVFTSSAVDADQAKCFFSSTGKIARNSDGTLSLK